MRADTIAFRVPLAFYDTLNELEAIFARKAIVTRLDGQQLQYQKKSVQYVRSSAQIKLSEYAYCTIKQYKTHSESGVYHTFIEIHGIKQYQKNGTPIYLKGLESQLKHLIEYFKPTLWRIEMPYDVLASFDEVSPCFEDYYKPYSTTYESHDKKSTVATRYQLYCKTTKDDLEINVTRLEMKRDYSRKRSPIILETVEDLIEEEDNLYMNTKAEFEEKCPNVYTPNQYALDEAEVTSQLPAKELNLLHDTIIGITVIDNSIQLIHLTGKKWILYKDSVLYYPTELQEIAKQLATPIINRAEIEAHQPLRMPKALPPF